MAKGRKTGGRKADTPNKTTADVRNAIALIAERNVGAFESWLAEIPEPARRCELFLRMLEYHVPKLARSEVTGPGDGAMQIQAVEFHIVDHRASPQD